MLNRFLKTLFEAPACALCRQHEATRGLLCVYCYVGECEHDYQLETVGGVYLTGAYVCRLCSYRIGMSHEQFHRHANYPRHYQDQEDGKTINPEPNTSDKETIRTRS